MTEIIKLSVNIRTKTWLPSWLDTEKDVFLFASSNMHSINVTQNLNSTILLYFFVQLPLTPLSLSNARIAASSLYARLIASGNTIESGILKWREALMWGLLRERPYKDRWKHTSFSTTSTKAHSQSFNKGLKAKNKSLFMKAKHKMHFWKPLLTKPKTTQHSGAITYWVTSHKWRFKMAAINDTGSLFKSVWMRVL